MTTITFTDSDADFTSTTIYKAIGAYTVIFSGGYGNDNQGLGIDTYDNNRGVYAYEGPEDQIKLTLTVNPGYTFDVNSFGVGVDSGQLAVSFVYGNGSTDNFTQSLTAGVFQTLSSFSKPLDDVKQVVLSSDKFGLFQNFGISDIKAIVATPTVTDGNISIVSTGTGTDGAYRIGDTVTARWDDTATGDNNAGVTGATMDFSQFGGGSGVTATSDDAGHWTASYTIASGSIDATGRNVSVSATNTGGTTTTADSTNLSVDNTPPTVTDARINISGASGTGGAYKVGDTVTATWNNTAGGDNNADALASVRVDFSQFGGGSAVAATNSGGVWSASYTLTAGTVDGGSNRNVVVTATDNAGNTTTTADTTNATVDTVAPTAVALSTTSAPSSAATAHATIATLSSADASSVTYALDRGDGIDDVDNSSFAVDGDALRVGDASLAAGAYHINLSATDAAGNVTTVAETITVEDPPSVTSIVRSGGAAAALPASAASVSYTVAFSEGVTGVDAGDFAVTTVNGNATATVASVTPANGSANTYTVSLTNETGDGTLRLDLNASNTGITDTAGNPIATGFTQGESTTFDHTPPMIAISTVAGDNAVNAAEAAQGFSVSGTTTAEDGQVVTLRILNAASTAVDTYTVATSGGAYSAAVTPMQAQALADGIYTVTANVSDFAGNPATEATQPITADKIAPGTPQVAIGNDTGVSQTDRVTSDPALAVTPAESGGTLLYSTDGGTTYTTIAPTFATDGTADGQHTIDVEQRDTAGNTSAPGSLTFALDTTPPDITSVTETGNGIGANGNGDVPASTVVTFTVQTDGPVYVTPATDGSTPTLVFNNGGVATYTGQTGAAVNQLTFSYTVRKGQDTKGLKLADVTGSGDVIDQAGNPIDLGSLAMASLPTGTLVVDTIPPVASSPTDTVAQNSGPAPIGIAAPSDNLTSAGSLAIAAGALPTDGIVTLADGTTPVVSGQALTAAQLTGLEFTPTQGLSNQGSTFTYTVTDGAGNATTGTAALNIGSPGAPTITGTHPTTDQAEALVAPFAGVTVADPSNAAGAMETLSIALTGQSGTLTEGASYAGPRTLAGGGTAYQITGTAAQVTQELDALSFTPTAGAPGATISTTFVLTDRSSAGTSVTDSGTSVADTATAAAPPSVQQTPGMVSLDQMVSYRRGVFTLTGAASSAAGVAGVEISAVLNDGTRQDLGAATLNGDGTFSFADRIGANQQGFIKATLTDSAGVQTISADAAFSLAGGLNQGGYKARQIRYTADGDGETAMDLFKANGSQKADLLAGGQTFTSSFFDTFNNGGAPDTTFVFNPGFGRDVVDLFGVDGADHDVLSFKGSDYGNLIATVLNNSRDTAAGLLLTDPTASTPGGGPGTHDTLLLKGITKQQLAQNQGDIAFHA